MKTVYHSKSTLATRMLAFVVLAAVLAVMSCKDDNNNYNPDTANMAPFTISGNASGAQMVPPVPGNGTATISGTSDPQSRKLTYTSNWSGLSGRPISAGFFAGAPGDSSAIAIGSTWKMDSTLMNTGSISGSMTITPDQFNALTAGSWYYSYGTVAHPKGEVRGQITATQGQQATEN